MRQVKTDSQGGFTLIETLMVLFIFIAVTGIVMISFQSLRGAKDTQYFFEQLQKDLYFSQEYALAHHEEVNLVFQPGKHRYYVAAGKSTLLKRPFGPGISVRSNFGRIVQFNPNGNIARFGTLSVSSLRGAYKIVFHIGKGRFYVEKK